MQALRIMRVIVANLFGSLTHTIDINSSGITFIHGPNGCGKTTILDILNSIFSFRFRPLLNIDFTSITIEFTNETILEILQKERKSKSPHRTYMINENSSMHQKYITVKLKNNGQQEGSSLTIDAQKEHLIYDLTDISPATLSEKAHFLRRVGARRWRDMRTDDMLSYEEAMEIYAESILLDDNEIPEWLKEMKKSISIQYIKTQRLFAIDSYEKYRENERRIPEAIQIYALQLEEMISRKLAEQAMTSQRYDSSFPRRLLEGNIRHETEKEIRARYKKIEEKTKSLVDAGLISKLDHIPLPRESMPENQLQVMTLYLDDMDKKLSVFDDLLEKIQTFLSIIKPKFRGKELSINRDDGFSISLKSKQLKNKQKRLRASQLSSGEQHQIVLFYELIFKAEKNSLYLIDEPEISLHVDWQRDFVGDLLKVKNLGNCYFIVATHSPQIIGKHFDNAVALEGGVI